MIAKKRCRNAIQYNIYKIVSDKHKTNVFDF